MGQVVPFIARVRDSGDWSATERARLQELADRLAAGGVDVEVIFGATDEGDPWCVVTDGNGDVLIHVARIDGVFVVHSAVDDAVNENVDLHTALRDRLAATEEAIAPESATILPFGLTARQGQTFLALVVAAAFFYETSGVAGTAEAAELPQDLPPPEPAPPSPDDAPTQERELATQGATQHQQPMSAPMAVAAAAVQASQPTTSAAPAEDARAAAPTSTLEAPPQTPAHTADAVLTVAKAGTDKVIEGTSGDDLLVGTIADEHILGGDGADTLRGGGGNDVLEGGAGDDVIELATGVVAVGGEGADTFVIQAPTRLGAGETLLGVVIDFSGFEGDRVTLANGRAIDFWRPPPTKDEGEGGETGPTTGGGDDFTGQGVDPTGPTGPTLQPGPGDFGPTLVGPPLTRVDVDVDGDGVMDGYILVGARGHVVGGEDSPIVIARPPGGDDLFG